VEQPGQVLAAVARERNRVLRELASEKKTAFMRSLRGSVVEAITLRTGGADFTEALTDNYLKMKIFGHHEANRWMDVKVEGAKGEMLLGKPLVDPAPEPAWSEQRWNVVQETPPNGSNTGVHRSQQTH
jgi:tRNA A37 methylthiotransferase MiaB